MATKTKYEVAQMNYEKIQRDNELRLSVIQKQIDSRISAGRPHEDLDQQMDQARRVAQKSEDIAKKAADDAKAQQDEQDSALRQRLDALSDEASQKMKDRARISYVKQGGKEQDFESAWPTLRDEMLKAKVVQDTTGAEQRRPPIVKGL